MSLMFTIAGGILIAIVALIVVGFIVVIAGNLIHAFIIKPRQQSKMQHRNLQNEKIEKEIEDYYKTATREQMEEYLAGKKYPHWLGCRHTEFELAIKRLEELKMK